MEKQCSIGSVLQEKCSRTTYTRHIAWKTLGSLPKDNKEEILWRCGLREYTFSEESVTIWIHHELVYGNMYER